MADGEPREFLALLKPAQADFASVDASQLVTDGDDLYTLYPFDVSNPGARDQFTEAMTAEYPVLARCTQVTEEGKPGEITVERVVSRCATIATLRGIWSDDEDPDQ